MKNISKKSLNEKLKDKRLSPTTRKNIKELLRYVGTDKKIPTKLQNKIVNNKSNSDIVESLKNYNKNKK